MKNREARHRKIRHLILAHRIESQEVLREKLNAEGFAVTQATLSRDLRYLQVGKVADVEGGYYYGIQDGPGDYAQDLLRGWISIAFSGNVGVVKTLPGHANSVAVAIDNLEFEELLGTVAGDDTIILILSEGADHSAVLRRLRDSVPGLAEAGDSGQEH